MNDVAGVAGGIVLALLLYAIAILVLIAVQAAA
jgi:hypothetical protein